MQFGALNELLEYANISLNGIPGDIPTDFNLEPPKNHIPTTIGNIDTQLAQAALDVLNTGNLTPLIKEELKTKIQAQRLQNGKEELQVVFEKAAKCELREEEKEKILKRKEANRLAAIRFRRKRKSREQELDEECKQLEMRNSLLLDQIKDLEEQRHQLLEAISCIKSPP